ncbi:hypothetical protein X777_16180 [Ooceraea biroi]|uniref:Uncharacterized protein n=1 Tax=Ooceraea biroi TaxID=2015173 RepID=A0A026WVC7_OOCBI|nr:hypothetical protein X777_16180 [Ooceraea biroi]
MWIISCERKGLLLSGVTGRICAKLHSHFLTCITEPLFGTINLDRLRRDRDCPCVERLNSKNSLTTGEPPPPPTKKLPLGEVGETKANEVAGEKTSFCPESLAGCSPFVKVRCTPTTPWYRYQPPWAREEGKKESEGEKEGARRGKTDGGRRTYPGGWRRRKEKPEEKEEVEMEGRREIKMAAPASGVDPPTLPPRGNKRKKGRKLRSNVEGGRSACRGATNEATNRVTGGSGVERG